MQVDKFVLGELQTNCYLLRADASPRAIIIDPADDGDFLNDELLRNQLTLEAVVLTHGHFDHCLGLLSLYTAWQMPIYLHKADQFLLAQAPASAQHWLGRQVDPVPSSTHQLVNEQQLNFLGEDWQVLHTPGHTPGSICLLHPASRTLFSGDTIFAGGSVGRTDFSYSDPTAMRGSLAHLRQLAQQGVYAEVWAGHGESFFV